VAAVVVHQFVSTVPDPGNPDRVQPSHWNQTHSVVIAHTDLDGAVDPNAHHDKVHGNEAHTTAFATEAAITTAIATHAGLSDPHSPYALVSHAFVVVGAVPARLTAGRQISAGSGISFVDNGAGSTLVISADVAGTDEQAQDAVGGILVNSSSIAFTYNDGTPSITAVVLAAGVDHNSLANLTTGDVHTHYLKEKLAGGLASEVPEHTHVSTAEAGIVAHSSLSSVTANQHHNEDHATRHEIGGADPVNVEELPTAFTALTLELHPDGLGGTLWSFPTVVDSDPNAHAHITEDFSASTDGAVTTFTLAYIIVAESSAIFLNGLRLRLGVDYTEGVQTIVMTTAPANDDELVVDYHFIEVLSAFGNWFARYMGRWWFGRAL